MRFSPYILALSLLILQGCKSDADKIATERLVETGVQSVSDAIIANEPSPGFQFSRLQELCRDIQVVSPHTTENACRGITPASAIDADRELLVEYVPVSKHGALAKHLAEQAAEARKIAIAEATLSYWQWTVPVEKSLSKLDTQINAAIDADDWPADNIRPSVAILPAGLRKEIQMRLERAQAPLVALAPKQPAESVAGLVNAEKMAAMLRRAVNEQQFVELREMLIDQADNEAWAATTAQNTSAPNLAKIRRTASAQIEDSALRVLLAHANSIKQLRVSAGQPLLSDVEALTDEAAVSLASDCSALLSLDEAEFDATCGPIQPIIEHAVAQAERATDGLIADRSEAPAPPPEPPSSRAEAKTGLAELKQRLRVFADVRLAPEGFEVPDAFSVDDLAKTRMVRGLSNRIKVLSRTYAESAYQGHLQGLIEAEVIAEQVLRALERASTEPLPKQLSNPFALLEPNALKKGVQEWTRQSGVLRRASVYFQGDPILQIAYESAEQVKGRLVEASRANIGPMDLEALLERMDPKTLDALLGKIDTESPPLIKRRMKLEKERFRAFPVDFDRWRGPRGPPRDPNFRRSTEILGALEQLFRNPTRFVEEVSRFKAEHADFYRGLQSFDASTGARWQFGESSFRAWMLSQLAPADLAELRLVVMQVRPAPGTAELVVGWPERRAEAEKILTEIEAESQRRGEALPAFLADGKSPPPSKWRALSAWGRHPPGYPPGKPPELRKLALKWLKPGADLLQTSQALQHRVQTMIELYPDRSTLPSSLADDLKVTMDEILKQEISSVRRIVKATEKLDLKAGRSIHRLDSKALATLDEVKQKAGEAVDAMAKRLAMLERGGVSPTKPGQWAELRDWSFSLNGRLPPDAPANVATPEEKPIARTAIAYRELGLDAQIIRARRAITEAEASLKTASKIAEAETTAPSIGRDIGRAVIERSTGTLPKFDLAEMTATNAKPNRTRYPKSQHDWRGFFEKTDGRERPFSFESSVKNFRNFRGVGGGIHFGTHANPTETTEQLVRAGVRIDYNLEGEMLRVRLKSGESFVYGPVEPRVLKAIYHFITSHPGVNLAVTIGAVGDGELVQEDGQSPVLLDPSFVDTTVGQQLYLADTLPWNLHEPLLPNGLPNPAAEAFKTQMEAFTKSGAAQREALIKLVAGQEPLSALSVDDLERLIPVGTPKRAVAIAVARATNGDSFRKIYRAQRLAELGEKFESTSEYEVMRSKSGDTYVRFPLKFSSEEFHKNMLLDAQLDLELKPYSDLMETDGRRSRMIKFLPYLFEYSDAKIRVPDYVLRLATAAKLREGATVEQIAVGLPYFFRSPTGLAVLFDDSTSFELVDGKLNLSAQMRYRYAAPDFRVEDRGLVFYLDDKDTSKPIQAREIDGLAEQANKHFAKLADVFEPLKSVERYAALAGFLRWASCVPASHKTCEPRPGVRIDFSALGTFPLRDRKATPTPDADIGVQN